MGDTEVMSMMGVGNVVTQNISNVIAQSGNKDLEEVEEVEAIEVEVDQTKDLGIEGIIAIIITE